MTALDDALDAAELGVVMFGLNTGPAGPCVLFTIDRPTLDAWRANRSPVDPAELRQHVVNYRGRISPARLVGERLIAEETPE